LSDPSIRGSQIPIDSSAGGDDEISGDAVDGDVPEESSRGSDPLGGKIGQVAEFISDGVVGEDLVQIDISTGLEHVSSSDHHDVVVDNNSSWFGVASRKWEIGQSGPILGGDVERMCDVDVLDILIVVELSSQGVDLSVDGSGVEVVPGDREVGRRFPVSKIGSEIVRPMRVDIIVSVPHASDVVEDRSLECDSSRCSSCWQWNKVDPGVVDGVVSPGSIGGLSGMLTQKCGSDPDVPIQFVRRLIQEWNRCRSLAVASAIWSLCSTCPCVGLWIVYVDSMGRDQVVGSKSSQHV